jgi:hypothetical protein
MRRFVTPISVSLAALLVLASCVEPAEKSAPAPVPAPRPAPAAPAPAPSLPAPQSHDWTLRPASAGGWTYRAEPGGSAALFGPAGAAALLTVRCEKAGRRVHVARAGAGMGPMILRTSYGAVNWPVSAGAAETVAIRAAGDSALDQIAYSRGRFAIEVGGLAPLILPGWAEVARVIEDCRD